MKNSLQPYDAVLAPTIPALPLPKNALVLGGEAGKKREFDLLLQTDPERAIQTEIGRNKLVEILAYFNSHLEKEKSRSYPKQGVVRVVFHTKTASALKPEFKLRQYPNDNNIRVYSLLPYEETGYINSNSYAGYIRPQTLWELPQYFPNRCEKALRPIICKKILTQDV
ncbi:MAG: hypothetical protein J7647_30985 [Cyanobacteria bacterium SBLK]|nr:hypothetical protein [Cyanobacteria bacterium SBLK]